MFATPRRPALLLSALLVGLSIGGPLLAAFEARESDWEGLSELFRLSRERLGRDRVVLVASLDFSALSPADALLVIHPERTLDFRQLSAFLQSGGRLAVLDDYGGAASLLSQFGIRRVRAPRHPALTIGQNRNLPIAVPVVDPGASTRRHPIVENLDYVVTNHPQALEHPGLTPLLVIPAQGEPDATLALTAVIAERGRLFAMSDPSVFINLMMRYPGNRALAEGLLDYLLEPRGTGTRGKLFVAVNRFSQRGSYAGTDSFAASVRGWLSALRDRADKLRAEGVSTRFFRMIAMAAAVIFGFWLWSVSGKPYRRALPRYAARVPLAVQGGVAGRAALLAAPTTHRALPALELQSALVEGLSEQLGLASDTSAHAIVQEVARRGVLSTESLAELRRVVAEFREVELRFTSARPVRVTQARLESWRQQVLRLLDEASRTQGRA